MATKDEMKPLLQNDTWDLIDLPFESPTISCKWVYKFKLKSNGNVDCYKARFVTRGFTQT